MKEWLASGYGSPETVMSGSVVRGRIVPPLSSGLGWGREKEGPEGTDGDSSMPTISLLEMVETDGTWLVTMGLELCMDRTSVLVSPVASLDETGSISDGILTGGLAVLWREEILSAEPPDCIWMIVLLAALPLEADLFVCAVTRESVVSMGSV